eukprot:216858_1
MKRNTKVISIGVAIISVYLLRWSFVFNRNMNRKYVDSSTIGNSYNQWTEDGILEYYWGNHIHLGYYPNQTATNVDFREAKREMTFRLFEWAHQQTGREIHNVNKNNQTLLDAGCGFGGSTLSLTEKYKLGHSIGITLSDEIYKEEGGTIYSDPR